MTVDDIWARVKDCAELALPKNGYFFTYWPGVMVSTLSGRYVLAGATVDLVGALVLGTHGAWMGNTWSPPVADAARLLGISEADVLSLCYGFDGINRGHSGREWFAIGMAVRAMFLERTTCPA